MLILGWASANYAIAWFANPLLFLAFVLARPNANPAACRWLVYGVIAITFIQPFESLASFWPLPFLPLLASPVILLVGIELFRAKYRQAYAKFMMGDDVTRH